MKNKIKIKKLEKEITELEKKKSEKDEVKDLLKKRNEMKFQNLYSLGRIFKNVGTNIADWADKKNKEQEKEDKKTGKKKEKTVDIYESLFGESDIEM